ncbi:MAG: hypothetical protein QOF57_2623 [Frankiaceae bacterium]|jgi:hypothetical protein|nr:hypothetical protein [Frankiaceae bacterium]
MTRVVAGTGVTLLAISGATLSLSGTGYASSHREAPLIAGDPRADNTDLYAFVSPDAKDTVTLVANWIPMEEPNGGPNFYPFAENTQYQINIDNNGDGAADLVYTWLFKNHVRDSANQFLYNTGVVNNITDPTLNFYQTYSLTRWSRDGYVTVLKDAIAAPSFTGKASMPDYGKLRAQAVRTYHDGKAKTYAGQADDPFFLDLRIFDLLYGGNLSETGHDTLSGYNVNTIALQVPKSDLALRGNAFRNPVVGIWSTTNERSMIVGGGVSTPVGDYRQVSRLGNPLVNEVVIPLKYKDAFNAISPAVDHTVGPVVAKVLEPIVPKLVQAIYGIKAPATPRNDLVEIFLTGIAKNAPTLNGSKAPIQADLNSQVLNKDVEAKRFVPAEELRLNMAVPVAATPNRLGVLGGDFQGFPNGRRLTDDVVDIGLQALEGAAQTGQIVQPLAAGDGVNANDRAFGATFPYVALPNENSVNNVKGAPNSGSALPVGGIKAPLNPLGVAAPLAGLAALVLFGATAVTRQRRRHAIHASAAIQ